jgi:hypothetical protein
MLCITKNNCNKVIWYLLEFCVNFYTSDVRVLYTIVKIHNCYVLGSITYTEIEKKKFLLCFL